MLKLIKVSAVDTEKVRNDGKASRKYVTMYFINPKNPLQSAQRNVFEQHTPDGKSTFWKGGVTPELLASFVGQEMDGSIKRFEVEPYEINGRQATSYTCAILEGEFEATILAQAGHKLAGTVAQIAQPAGNDVK